MSAMNVFSAVGPDGLQLTTPIFRLHEDLLVEVVKHLPIQYLLHLTHVCRVWRAVLLRCKWIWGRLDLRYLGDRATPVAISLFPRSGDALIDLSICFTDRVSDGTVRNLLQSLAAHAHRLRHLSLESMPAEHYDMVFGFLRNQMPGLHSLDVSPGVVSEYHRPVQPPSDMLIVAPRLAHLNWGINLIPSSLNCMGNVTHLRIRPSKQTLTRIFTLFPRITYLRIDRSPHVEEMQMLPIVHPLQRFKLCEDPTKHWQIAPKIAWSVLDRLGVTRIQFLLLRNYGLSALFAACEAGWKAHTLVIEYDDRVDATLARGEQQCRMLGLVGGGWHGEPACSVNKLLYQRACLRDLVSLTMSIFRPVGNSLAMGVLPCIVLHALATFTFICGQPPPSSGPLSTRVAVCSLLDDALLRGAGTLRAPNLRTMRLQARTPQGDNDDEILPAALARFVGEHIQLQPDGARLPELRVDHPRVRFSDDPEGLAALTSLVDVLVYGL